jgi:isopentenyldiphosphate isomerase
MEDGQDQNELFDVMPDPEKLGIITDEALIANLKRANQDGLFRTVTRKKAHAEGIWHRSIGLWLYTSDRKVIVQRRSELKDTNPGNWQMSVAGHVSSGDSVEEAVLSEAHEELGLTLSRDDLRFVGAMTRQESGSTSRFGNHVDREYKFLFMAKLPAHAEVKFNPAEIQEIEFMDCETAFAKFKNRDPAYCRMDRWGLDECLKLIKQSTQ